MRARGGPQSKEGQHQTKEEQPKAASSPVKGKGDSGDASLWKGWDAEEMRVYRWATAKGLGFTGTVLVIYVLMVRASAASSATLPEPSARRAVAQVILALSVLTELLAELFSMPPATKDQEAFPLMQTAGKAVFMTYWITSLQVIHQVATAMAEVALFLGMPMPQLMKVTHQGSVLVGSLGVMLCLLFLGLNYFEAKWRKNVKDLWESRGYPMGFMSLLGHVPSLPVGVLDLVVKDRVFFHAVKPSFFPSCVAMVLAFAVMYTSWMHVFWYLSDFKCWPYPFLHDLDSIVKRMGFVVVVTVAIVSLMLPLHYFS